MNDGGQFEEALRRFDQENERDPNRVVVEGQSYPREWLYARRLFEWVLRLEPGASQTLLLAARCQHLCRWAIPRGSYEMTRAGYLKWRSDLKRFHAQKSAEILLEVGYGDDVIRTVQDLNLKKNLGSDPDCQVLEDALCLMTLQYQLSELMARTEPDKLAGILQKTWKKMSPEGRRHALELSFTPDELAVVRRALA